jgi:hypothetical protein
MSRRSSPRKRPLSLTRGSADCDPPTPTSTSTLPTTSDVLVTTGAATAASGTPPTGASDTTSTIDAVATTTTTTTSEDGDTGDGTADVEDGAGDCGVTIALDGRREATDRPRGRGHDRRAKLRESPRRRQRNHPPYRQPELMVLHSERFVDQAPATVVARLMDESARHAPTLSTTTQPPSLTRGRLNELLAATAASTAAFTSSWTSSAGTRWAGC